MSIMTLKRYVVVRTLIVAFALLWMGWLYFSRPEVILPAGAGASSCHPVAWRYQGEGYTLLSGFDVPDSKKIWDFLGEPVKNLKYEDAQEYYRKVEERIDRSCEIARSDRRMFINVAAVVSVGLFLAVPKPRKTERSERNDSESRRNDSGKTDSGKAAAESA